ncbi:MAG: hypothetical protein ABI632_10100, partial [Pseudolysinimonas sp.]
MSRQTRTLALLLPLAAAALAVALTGCQPTAPVGGDGSASPSVVPSDSAAPSEAPAGPVFALPADCTAIASQATLNQIFGQISSREPGDLVRSAPASAQKLLTCSWFEGDTTGGDIIYYSAPAADSAAYLAVVAADGFTCSAALEGTRCDKTTPNSQFPVDTVETVFTRD